MQKDPPEIPGGSFSRVTVSRFLEWSLGESNP